jgi:uncharacterized protein YbgA (DUF1722 family)/uncharacterized protein YbbK (DUF523 family)
MTDTITPVITIGISSCLLGDEVRYDGGHKRHSYIEQTLGEYFQFRRFCPEMAIGMGVPRDPIRLVRRDDGIRAVGIKNPALDVTDRLAQCADAQRDWQAQICGYIFKKDSPSCGMERVKVYSNQVPSKDGSGIFAQRVMQNFPYLPIEEEGRLGDSVLRENFIQRVYILYRWRQMLAAGLSMHQLTRFHAQHKLIIMSHNQNSVRELGKLLANNKGELSQLAEAYLHKLMECLKEKATRGNHVNVLQHIQGYLKKNLDADDKAELVEVIEKYRLGEVPLIVPVTLLKHHFRKAPDDYIDDSFYMNPYPSELCLLNHI